MNEEIYAIGRLEKKNKYYRQYWCKGNTFLGVFDSFNSKNLFNDKTIALMAMHVLKESNPEYDFVLCKRVGSLSSYENWEPLDIGIEAIASVEQLSNI